MLKNIIENATTYSVRKIIKNSMNTQLKLKNIDYEIIRNIDKSKSYLLYIHIPFCETFCPYCSFHKFKYDEKIAKQYFMSLRKELKKVKEEGLQFNSLYVGGGTTLINDKELLKTLELAKTLFDIEDISCESDPNHISRESLSAFDGIIKRLSIGVQSFDDYILKKISRYDKFGSAKQIQHKIDKIQGLFPITNIDLIFNFPSQTEPMLLHDLHTAKTLGVEQVTTYPLMNTSLTKESIAKAFEVKNNSNEYLFYQVIQDYFSDFYSNNAWSFSKFPSKMSDEYLARHNEYIGVGSGAFSFVNDTLYVNSYNLEEYKELVDNRSHTITAISYFDFKPRIQYHFLTWLFNGAIDIKEFNETFKCSLTHLLKQELYMLKKVNAITVSYGKISPTAFGTYLSLVIMKEFYSGMDIVRAMLKEKNLELSS